MGKLELVITFRGGKAEEHRLSTDTLAKVFSAISSDIENVYRVVSYADVNITSDDVKRDSKLYLSAEPAAGSLKLFFMSEETDSDWIEITGREYGRGLRLLAAGRLEDSSLPFGVSILEHVKTFASPKGNEYEVMDLTIPQDSEPDIEISFDESLGLAAEKQIVELKTLPPSIHSYEIEGIMHALDDQDYTKPVGLVNLKVATPEGDWICSIDKRELPMDDLNEIWGKRVFMRGFATFRPRKKTLVADKLEILPDRPGLLEAMNNFIRVNEGMWEGQDPTKYLDSVREKELENE